MNSPSHQARREMHEIIRSESQSAEAKIIRCLKESPRPLTALDIAELTGLDKLYVRPRLTELCDESFCAQRYGRTAVLKQMGRVRHPGSRVSITSYALDTTLTTGG